MIDHVGGSFGLGFTGVVDALTLRLTAAQRAQLPPRSCRRAAAAAQQRPAGRADDGVPTAQEGDGACDTSAEQASQARRDQGLLPLGISSPEPCWAAPQASSDAPWPDCSVITTWASATPI